MSQHPAYETGSFILSNRKDDDAVIGVTQVAVVEAEVAGEEGDATQAVQQGNDGDILGARTPDFASNLADRNAPTPQELSLAFGDVLVEGG